MFNRHNYVKLYYSPRTNLLTFVNM